MQLITRLSAVALAIAVAQSALADTLFSNFEQPTYPAAPADYVGTDGWITFGGFHGLSPDPGGSGYVSILEGAQSAWTAGFVARPWGSTSDQIDDQFNIVALFFG